MSFEASRVNVSDVATEINLGAGQTALAVRNLGEQTVYVGGSGVTDANGFPVEAGEVLHLSGLALADVLSVICATGLSSEVALLAKDPA